LFIIFTIKWEFVMVCRLKFFWYQTFEPSRPHISLIKGLDLPHDAQPSSAPHEQISPMIAGSANSATYPTKRSRDSLFPHPISPWLAAATHHDATAALPLPCRLPLLQGCIPCIPAHPPPTPPTIPTTRHPPTMAGATVTMTMCKPAACVVWWVLGSAPVLLNVVRYNSWHGCSCNSGPRGGTWLCTHWWRRNAVHRLWVMAVQRQC
jgi:hypothetical protein